MSTNATSAKRAQDARPGALIFASLACWPKLLRPILQACLDEIQCLCKHTQDKKKTENAFLRSVLLASVLLAASSPRSRLCQKSLPSHAQTCLWFGASIITARQKFVTGESAESQQHRWQSRISCQPRATDYRARARCAATAADAEAISKARIAAKTQKPWRPRPTLWSRSWRKTCVHYIWVPTMRRDDGRTTSSRRSSGAPSPGH